MRIVVLILRLVLIIPLAVFSFSTSSSASPKDPIPITVLSGFLGSGKTTLLQNLLENKEGLRIAVIVNDVASVNIDSKLVANQQATPGVPSGMVELQNGCACCSLSDELMNSVTELITMSDIRKDEDQFQHIIIELSGVADPKQVRNKFQEAFLMGNPVMSRVRLDTMITLIDSSMFMTHFQSDKIATRKETPELFYRNGERPANDEKKIMNIPKADEEWMKDLPPQLLKAIMSGLEANQAQQDEENGVADLLVSQTETSDVVVLNKIDLVNESEVNLLEEIVGALNPRATIKRCAYGKLPLMDILAVAGGKGVVEAGAIDDHREAVIAALGGGTVTESNDKSIAIVEESVCTDPDCTDTSHSHSHDHHDEAHSHAHTQTSSDATISADPDSTHTSSSSSHAHSHDHATSADCTDPNCTDSSHSHAHSHSHDSTSECNDPDCRDESHSHSHTHSSHAGIGTYVYKARRPFHPTRMAAFLSKLPVVRGIPEPLDDNEKNRSIQLSDAACKALKSTLRSKGFCWCADSHSKAMYWSHAGSSFDLSCLGQWWATLPRDQWPDDAVDYVLTDFDDVNHSEEDASSISSSVGDRRQEIVFIGPKFGDQNCQILIRDALNQCLLKDDEFTAYMAMKNEEDKLSVRWANPVDSRVVSY